MESDEGYRSLADLLAQATEEEVNAETKVSVVSGVWVMLISGWVGVMNE